MDLRGEELINLMPNTYILMPVNFLIYWGVCKGEFTSEYLVVRIHFLTTIHFKMYHFLTTIEE